MTKLLFICLMFASLALLPKQSCAQQHNPATLRDLVVLGLAENIGLQVEQLNTPISASAVVTEESLFDVDLFGTGGFSKSSTPVSSSLSLTEQSNSELLDAQLGLRKKFLSGLTAALTIDSQWQTDNSQTDDLDPRYRTYLNLSVSQPLLRNAGSMVNSARLRQSRNQLEQTSLRHLLFAQRLALDIELMASKLVGDTAVVALRHDAVALAEELLAANRQRFDAGVIAVSEVQEAQTALANRQLELSLIEQSRELSFEQLNRQLNHSLSGTFDPAPLYAFNAENVHFKLPDLEPLFATAFAKNITLQLGEFEIQNRQIQRSYYKNQLKPQLDLTVAAGLNGLSGDNRSATVSNRYSGSWSDSLSNAAQADGYQWAAGLEFSVPLGNRSAQSRLRQASLQYKQANYQQLDLKSELKSQLLLQTTNLQRALGQVRIAQRFEALAALSLQQEQRRLDEGLSDTFRIIAFQDNMLNASIGRIKAQVQYYSSAAELNFTTGTILEQRNIILPQETKGVTP